jgi:hypothetical protein
VRVAGQQQPGRAGGSRASDHRCRPTAQQSVDLSIRRPRASAGMPFTALPRRLLLLLAVPVLQSLGPAAETSRQRPFLGSWEYSGCGDKPCPGGTKLDIAPVPWTADDYVVDTVDGPRAWQTLIFTVRSFRRQRCCRPCSLQPSDFELASRLVGCFLPVCRRHYYHRRAAT